MNTVTLTARYLFTGVDPPFPGGTVTIRDGRIAAVEPRGMRAADVDLGNAAIIPGLVNAHTHLDLSAAGGLTPPTNAAHFTDWLRSVIAFRQTRDASQTLSDIEAGIGRLLEYGTTLVGDISSGGESAAVLAASPIRSVVFLELIGLPDQRARLARARLDSWLLTLSDTSTSRPGVSPHAPYSVRGDLLKTSFGLPTSIHLAESPAERELIESRSGPFIPFLDQLGAWDESGLLRDFAEIIETDRDAAPVLFVHCNYLKPADFKRVGSNASVVYCPRTHAAFQHPPHPFEKLREQGIPVCLGTDSLASNPDLDILSEARFLHARYPNIPGSQLLRLVTLAGAEALGWADETGSLEIGKSADLVVIPLPDREAEDPFDLLLSDFSGERRTLFRGVWRTEKEAKTKTTLASASGSARAESAGFPTRTDTRFRGD